MDIQSIKEHLSLSRVLQHYGLTVDRNNRLQCPFHPDKTPSLQIYLETNTCYCFSSNCKTHGKSIDVIDFMMYKENISKYEAILKAKNLISPLAPKGGIEVSKTIVPPATEERILFLENIFSYFKNAVYNNKPAQEYIQERRLDYQFTDIGYNSGQFHHGTRRDEELINNALKYGLLLDNGKLGRTGNPAYSVFGKNAICFPLRDKNYQIVSLYFRSITNKDTGKHYYLKDRQGLYPSYPDKVTTKLILCESIIDVVSLLEQEEIRNTYSVLALYGTNGLTEEHKQAIQGLTKLSEIVLFMDGDGAGKQANSKYGEYFNALYPTITLSQVNTPLGEDINGLVQGHRAEILIHLLNERSIIEKEKKEETLFLSSEHKNETASPLSVSSFEQEVLVNPGGWQLNTAVPHNLSYPSEAVTYYIKGFRNDQLDSLKVTLQIKQLPFKLDLWDYKQVENTCKTASEKLDIPYPTLEDNLLDLSRELEHYRQQQIEKPGTIRPRSKRVDPAVAPSCFNFLRTPDLIQQINQQIGQAGIRGEEIL